jgi:quercetin dioxygenase-like cupin family protein
MKAIRTVVMMISIVVGALALHVAVSQPPGIRRTDLQRQDLGTVPGHEVVQVRNDFDPGIAFGRHWHPGEEIIYVVEGTFEYDVDGQSARTLNAGNAMVIPAGTIHSAKSSGSGKAAEVSTYVVEKGKPLTVMVK